jgi:hypothetical protein
VFLKSLGKFVDKEHMKEGMESDNTEVENGSELQFSELTQSVEMREAEYSVENEGSEEIQGHIAVFQDFLNLFPHSS